MASPKTPQQLIDDCQDLVRSLAWKIHRRLPAYLEIEDLIGYGELGLAQAAQDFDASRGGQFSTYAYYRIRGAIYDGLSKMTWFSRSHYQKLRFEQMANEVLGSDVEERGAAVPQGVRDEVQWLRGVSSSLAVVYLATHTDPEESAGEPVLEDVNTPSPPAAAIDHETRTVLHSLIDTLPEDANKLIRGVYFEGLTLQEAGRRLGVSKAWASRLHSKTLEQLSRSLRRAGLHE